MTCLGVLFLSLVKVAPTPDVAAPHLSFLDFLGTNQGAPARPGDPLWRGLGLRWTRYDVDWSSFEPAAGEWSEERERSFGELVLRCREAGVTLLPILDYTTPWAVDLRPWSFEDLGERHVIAAPDAEGRVEVTVTRLENGEVTRETKEPTGTWPPREDAWRAFVERFVGIFSAPPYNLRYFQIWNEPTRQAGFFYGGTDLFLQRIHVPAAEIIHAHGGRVVFGGWPWSNEPEQLADALDRLDAWDAVDIMAFHYNPPRRLEWWYERAVKPGLIDGLWMTEFGFRADPPGYVANTYPRAFHWALTHPAPDPEPYKVFWFAWWSPDDPAAYGHNACLIVGDRPTVHGRSLATLRDLLGDAPARPFDGFTTDPAVQPDLRDWLDAVHGFTVGDRIVLAFALRTETFGSGAVVTVMLPDLSPGALRASERVDFLGGLMPLEVEPDGAGTRLVVPVDDPRQEAAELQAGEDMRFFYVVVRSYGEAR